MPQIWVSVKRYRIASYGDWWYMIDNKTHLTVRRFLKSKWSLKEVYAYRLGYLQALSEVAADAEERVGWVA